MFAHFVISHRVFLISVSRRRRFAVFAKRKKPPPHRDGCDNDRGATLIRRPLARNGLCRTRTNGNEIRSSSMSRTMITASIPAKPTAVHALAATLSVGGSRVHSAPSPTPAHSVRRLSGVAYRGVLIPFLACEMSIANGARGMSSFVLTSFAHRYLRRPKPFAAGDPLPRFYFGYFVIRQLADG